MHKNKIIPMQVSKIILLNGAPGAGKDTSANILFNEYPGSLTMAFADHLKEEAHKAVGLDAPARNLDDYKDVPMPMLNGNTPRQLYIHYSSVIKRFKGDTHWASNVAETIKHNGAGAYVVSDLGYEYEAHTLAEEFGYENIRVVRLHRPDYGYEYDSRHLCYPEYILGYDVYNDGDWDALRYKLLWTLSEFLGLPESFQMDVDRWVETDHNPVDEWVEQQLMCDDG